MALIQNAKIKFVFADLIYNLFTEDKVYVAEELYVNDAGEPLMIRIVDDTGKRIMCKYNDCPYGKWEIYDPEQEDQEDTFIEAEDPEDFEDDSTPVEENSEIKIRFKHVNGTSKAFIVGKVYIPTDVFYKNGKIISMMIRCEFGMKCSCRFPSCSFGDLELV